jgi:hypothetical protein
MRAATRRLPLRGRLGKIDSRSNGPRRRYPFVAVTRRCL